ncbi:UDP-glucose 6-dehydrogenase [Candidatus Koribacter versatilis Ellin345]|uniref:UDP-glucose 6-dehydrogenase n=1 Tax=Koribacter versatilis (strain Ellin345) TaxID=204669 RepID=Q1IKV2_KORVE|nr:UDP-glucose/GDP-mannose dehydrogenase family protein [Candidatus Koribacter versatilis]ABF42498.1 UDP-glucose 6-dehydrogenase [Candidatus Koribacter versatilis Ellin345]
MNIAMIGSGYVGLVAAACLAEIGHNVICVDNDARKIEALSAGSEVIHEEFLPELLARHRGRRLKFTTSLHHAVRPSEIVFIAVGTPPCESGEADVSFIENVCRDIAAEINGHGPKTLVVKSTVPAGTSDWIRSVLVRNGVPASNFELASNPEFLREGSAVTDFLYPDRIVIGSSSATGTELLRRAYLPLTSGSYHGCVSRVPQPDDSCSPAKLIVTKPATAEMIKHASNAFLAMKVSFINAVANVCEAVGADVEELVQGMGSDRRIGTRFLKAGIGYGGSCFPKDVSALRAVAEDRGCDFQLLDEVMRINENQRKAFLHRVRDALGNLKGKRLAVLGLAFKGGTDDVRESPAIALVQSLLHEGCTIQAYDPAAMERAREEFAPNGKITFASSAYETARNADALLVLTDWEEFLTLDFARIRSLLRQPILFDGRNLYNPDRMQDLGYFYFSVGRREIAPLQAKAAEASSEDAA